MVEIAPSTLTATLRTQVIESAMRIARSIKYKSLGTFEFLVSPTHHEYYFLEINPRLQVEHTITETITSTDLVHLQIQIADGRTIEDLGLDIPRDDAELPTSVAMQLRVTAEDPRNGFSLSIGRINHLALPGGNGVRVDTHIELGTLVSSDFDSLLAKVIVHGPDYLTTIAKGLRALGDLSIEGPTTNVDLLKGILMSEAFQDGQCDTQWLEKNLNSIIEAGSVYQRRQKRPEAAIRSQATASAPNSSNTFPIKKGDSWEVSLSPKDGEPHPNNVRISKITRNDFPNSFTAEVSISSATSSHSDPAYTLKLTKAPSEATEASKDRRRGDKRNPAHLICPLSGQLVEMLVDNGDEVNEYEVVAIIRQMKMELEIRAHRRGRVQDLWDAEEGENVDGGTLVCEIVEASKPREKL